eukprot:c52397_g1_i1.p1 GENE.c52397_g1_i1~~c52397_g1_i1.p1  ORF type:complete len:379 (+),score=90.81 c52397_g1_i1:170-1138(+)
MGQMFGFPFIQPQQPQQQPQQQQPSYGYGQSAYGQSPYSYGQYGYPYGQFPYGQYQQQPYQQQQQLQEKFLWLCLEDIFPKNVRDQAGVPSDLGETLSSIATHAYVLYGATPQDSIAWQVQLNEGQRYWAQVLMDAKHIDREHPVEWGRAYAARITGATKITSLRGASVFAQSKKCFRSKGPSQCNNDDLRAFSTSYLKAHPRFNLANENCVLYACNVFNHCTGGCDVSACQSNLSFESMATKDPHCNTVVAAAAASNNNNNNLNLANGMMMNNQMNVVQWSDELRELMPLHDPKALDLIKELMAAEKPTDHNSDFTNAAAH